MIARQKIDFSSNDAKTLDIKLKELLLWRGYTENNHSSYFRALSMSVYGTQLFWKQAKNEIIEEFIKPRYQNLKFNYNNKLLSHAEYLEILKLDCHVSPDLSFVACNVYRCSIVIFSENEPIAYMPYTKMHNSINLIVLARLNNHYDYTWRINNFTQQKDVCRAIDKFIRNKNNLTYVDDDNNVERFNRGEVIANLYSFWQQVKTKKRNYDTPKEPFVSLFALIPESKPITVIFRAYTYNLQAIG